MNSLWQKEKVIPSPLPSVGPAHTFLSLAIFGFFLMKKKKEKRGKGRAGIEKRRHDMTLKPCSPFKLLTYLLIRALPVAILSTFHLAFVLFLPTFKCRAYSHPKHPYKPKKRVQYSVARWVKGSTEVFLRIRRYFFNKKKNKKAEVAIPTRIVQVLLHKSGTV